MISSKAESMSEKIRNRLLEFCTLMEFTYRGKDCNIDPFNPTHFHVCCDGVETDVDSIDRLMGDPLFCGKSLNEIADEIEDIEW